MRTPTWGVVLRIWQDEPVFHIRGWQQGWAKEVTACGRVIGPGIPYLPYKHVVKFARPCKGCMPA